MEIRELIELLKTKDQALQVQFLVVEPDTSIVVMELTDEVVDLQKLMKAFRKPTKAQRAQAQKDQA